MNQSLWYCNKTLTQNGYEPVDLIESPRLWENGQKVQTTFGAGIIIDFDPLNDLYDVELDWRPLDQQIEDYEQEIKEKDRDSKNSMSKRIERNTQTLQTVEEEDETNYLSPATSFETSKHSSKQSLPGMEKSSSGKSLQETVIEHQPMSSTHDNEDDFLFVASDFDRKTESLDPAVDEITMLEGNGKARQKKINMVSHKPFSAELETKKAALRSRHRAKISGRNIFKYTIPKLPRMKDDKNRSKFSFWSTDSLKGTVDGFESVKAKSRQGLSTGERVSTPYGLGFVVEHRQKSNIVVVDMSGPWKARAYLQESNVARDSSGFFGNILRQFSTTADKTSSPKSKSKTELDVGVVVQTPFGQGLITRSLPFKKEPSSSGSRASMTNEVAIIAISLKSWTLRDGSHPKLYCTVDAAKDWKNKNSISTLSHNRENSLFNVIGTLGSIVSGTVESLIKIRVPREIEAPAIKTDIPKFERYYKDGAAVNTSYGDGVVCSFRSSDGFYTVNLMRCGKVFATAYLHDDSMSYRLAKGCVEGYPVLTKFGSGVLHSVNPTTGVHNVTVPSFRAYLYLQPDQVIKPLKAAVGEDVSTPYGEGKVIKYRLLDDIYEIKLSWSNSVLFATASTFDRIDDRMEDKGGFGMNWILQFFYSREDGKDEGPQRSRSNSFSMLSQSGVSAKSAR